MDKQRKQELLFGVAAFAGTIVCALLMHWQTRDIIWGLWGSSLIVGYTTIVTTLVVGVLSTKGWVRIPAAAGGVFLLAFFTVHFGGFHYGHSVFLNLFFPLVPDAGDSLMDPRALLSAVISNYWPFIGMSLLSQLPQLNSMRDSGAKSDPLMRPYINVIRMHILIFVFAGLQAAKLSDYAIYPVLVFYFFPWGLLFKRKAATAKAV